MEGLMDDGRRSRMLSTKRCMPSAYVPPTLCRNTVQYVVSHHNRTVSSGRWRHMNARSWSSPVQRGRLSMASSLNPWAVWTRLTGVTDMSRRWSEGRMEGNRYARVVRDACGERGGTGDDQHDQLW
jgi:hypothetical protein